MDGNVTLLQALGLLVALVVLCYAAAVLAGLSPLWRIALPAALVPFLFQGLNYLYLGHLDPFFGVALVLSFPVCTVAAAGVHGLFESFRRRRPD